MLPDFTHPLEKVRFENLKANRAFNLIVDKLGSTHANLTTIAQVPDRCFAVTSQTFPRLHQIYQLAKKRLNIQNDYDIFCNMNYNRNAKTVGTNENCVIVVDSSCLEDFSDEQLLALIGRELGHIKMNHISYLTAFEFMDHLVNFLPQVISHFLDSMVINVVKGLLIDWMLAAEYTADRAAAIAAESIQPVMQNHLMTCGIENDTDSLNYEAYMQVDLPNLDGIDNVKKAVMTDTLRGFPIPFVILRMKELAKWSNSDECKKNFPQINFKRNNPTSLMKGTRVYINKNDILIGLGWDVGENFDLDASVFLLNSNDKVREDGDLIFYGNLKHQSGAVEYIDDNFTGNGDNKQIKINLEQIPPDIQKIVFTVTIYEAEQRKQNFGQVQSIFIRVVEKSTVEELIRYDLKEIFPLCTALVIGEIYRYKGKWKFNAIGAGFKGGLATLCRNYGIEIDD